MSIALFRDKQFGVKLEATSGVKETVAVGDHGLELSELGSTTGVEAIDNPVFKGTLSQAPSRIGKRTAGFTLAGELKNSGVLNTKPKIDTILQMARMVPNAVKSMAVSAVTGAATLKRGISVITNGTAKGLFVKLEGTTLFYTVISGSFTAADSLTSTPAGFTAAAGVQAVTNAGWVYNPSTTVASEKCGTVYVYDGGIAKSSYGMVASLALELSVDSFPKFTSTLTGVLDSTVWGLTATKQTAIVYENQLVPVVNAASLSIGGTVIPIASKVTMDLGNQLFVIPDLNAAEWLRHGSINGRQAVGSMSILALDPAVYSAYQALFAGQTASVEFKMGDVAGNIIEVFCPEVQYTGIADSDSNGFLASELSLKLTGIDSELFLWFR
jgi:hypothetical protein